MDPSVAIQCVALVILIVLSSFFSSAETSFVSVNLIRIRSLAENGNRSARRVLKITSDSSKMLSAILIGNNLVNISASSLATTITLRLWGNAAVSIATGLLTLVVLIFGEIAPKTIATTYAEKIALVYSGPIRALMVVLTPFIIVINFIAKGFLRIMGFNPDKHKASITEDELRTIVDVSREEGVIETDEHEMISNVFDFGESQAKDVMIPRIDMTSVSVDSTFDEIVEVFRKDKYTRLPVYEKSVDNVIGIINVKDLLLCEDKSTFSVRNILRKPYYTYEFKHISELMDELKKTSNNFTIVVDEYGSTVGMITLEDLLEEIVGDIRDEYDEDEEDEIIQLSDSEYIISGTTRLNDLDDIIKLPECEEDEDYDSISGFIVNRLDRLPQDGDEVITDNFRLVVDECDKYRIIKVHLYIRKDSETDSESTEDNE
ncbi:MAG: HlyC/CorC family transporter [Butyrivibrio sp.]